MTNNQQPSPDEVAEFFHNLSTALGEALTPLLNSIASAIIPLIEYADSIYEAAYGMSMQAFNDLSAYFDGQWQDEE
jgi:hypothetical protein